MADCVLARGQRTTVGRWSPWWCTVSLLVDSGQLWVGGDLGADCVLARGQRTTVGRW